MDLLYSLPENILQRIEFLQQDYVGITLDISVFNIFFVSLAFALFLTLLSYSLGKKISAPFNGKRENTYDYLFFIAVGYILIGTGIAFLGFLSLLNFVSITLFLSLIVAYSFIFPFSLKQNFFNLTSHVKNDFLYLKTNKFVFLWTTLFILLAVIKLINPEVREDQYHVDLPVMYLQNSTIMIPPREQISVSASPLLAEMHYTIGILYFSKEAARYIHFVFYILVLLTLINFSKLKDYKFAIYTPILFASAPVVIHETSSMYVDFQWIFCFLLSIIILIDHGNKRHALAKSGFLFGGMIAGKLWTIVFSVVPVLYLLMTKGKIKKRIKDITVFLLATLVVSSIWFARAYILTGNPLFPAFNNAANSDSASFFKSLSYFTGINYQLLNIFSFINVFSPLFFVSFVFLLHKFRTNLKTVLQLKLFKYLFFLFILYLSIQYPFGRYLLGLYVLFIFINSFAVNSVIRFKPIKILLNFVLFIVFSYYFINSVLVLPYSFDIADKNKYLSRILIRDASSYYDFGYKFDKYISQADNVAMYNFHGYYYANFKYTDLRFIYDNNQDSLNLLRQKKYTKLLIRSGDITWLCTQMKLTDCDTSRFSLISMYSEFPFYYLYNIN